MLLKVDPSHCCLLFGLPNLFLLPLLPNSEKAMAPRSSTLAWKIPWMEEPGKLQSMGSLRVRHNWATSLSLFTFMHWRRKWQPTLVFLPGESQGRGMPSMGSHRVGHDWSDLAAAAPKLCTPSVQPLVPLKARHTQYIMHYTSVPRYL